MSHHGRFIWYELITTDLDAASRFYEAVVGWTHDDMTNGDMTYRGLNADGNGVGGMLIIPPEAAARGAPPSWSGYVCVDDCDASAAKLQGLGGQVIRAPEDIPGIGRFAVVADPQGAVFAIMTPFPMETERPEVPAGTLGHTSWHELYTTDLDPAFDFYAEMFGWRKDDVMDMGAMGPYVLFANQTGVVGGMMRKPPEAPCSAWTFYFQVGDIDAAKGRIERAGGQVLNGPMEVPGEDWIIQGADPQGAMFAVVGKRGARTSSRP